MGINLFVDCVSVNILEDVMTLFTLHAFLSSSCIANDNNNNDNIITESIKNDWLLLLLLLLSRWLTEHNIAFIVYVTIVYTDPCYINVERGDNDAILLHWIIYAAYFQ